MVETAANTVAGGLALDSQLPEWHVALAFANDLNEKVSRGQISKTVWGRAVIAFLATQSIGNYRLEREQVNARFGVLQAL